MATSGARKPLPALAFLLALSLLTALVWWRVLHRAESSSQAATPSSSASCSPKPTITAVPAPAAVTVTILNSTQRTGLAASVGKLLTADGFKVAGFTNDLTTRAPVLGVAEIRFGPAGTAAATLLSYYVPGATFVPDTRATASVDLALGAKYTALAAAPAVAKALAAAHLTQLPPPTRAATTSRGTTHATTSAHSATTPAKPSPSAPVSASRSGVGASGGSASPSC